MTADGWATALFAAGATRGPELARRNGVAALFVLDRRQGAQAHIDRCVFDLSGVR